jgi:hypothetical protein
MMEYRHTLNNQHELRGDGARLIVAFRSEYEAGNTEDGNNNSHKYNSPATEVSMYGQIPREATRSCLCYEDVSRAKMDFGRKVGNLVSSINRPPNRPASVGIHIYLASLASPFAYVVHTTLAHLLDHGFLLGLMGLASFFEGNVRDYGLVSYTLYSRITTHSKSSVFSTFTLTRSSQLEIEY